MCTLSGHIECFKLYQQFNQDSGRAPERPLVPSTVREELLHHTYNFVFAGNQKIVDLNYTTGWLSYDNYFESQFVYKLSPHDLLSNHRERKKEKKSVASII